MAANRNTRNSRSPRPQFVYAPPPLTPDKGKLQALAEALGGMSGLVKKIVGFLTIRERETGWRVVQDAASRDRFHYDQREVPVDERTELPVPVPPMTAFLADATGEGEKWSREAILAALAAAADAPEVQQAGLSIRPTVNTNVSEPYSTVSVARRGTGIDQRQRALFAELDQA